MTRFEGPLGRWLNPRLGGLDAIVLTGCLIISHPDVGVAATPDWTAVAQERLATPPPSSLTPNKERDITPYSTLAHGQSTRSSMIDVLNAGLGTAMAALWLMGGAWVGIRTARIPTNSMNRRTSRRRADYDRSQDWKASSGCRLSARGSPGCRQWR
jgi:hypothetical protein